MAQITVEVDTDDFYDQLISFVKQNAKQIVYDINSVMAHEQYLKAKQICNVAITNWYNAYTPLAYRRNFGLFDGFDVGIRNGEVLIFEIGPENMTGYYHQGSEYVFEIAFMQGFHGGPIWRTPIPFFTQPLCPAEQSESPYSQIKREWDNYSNGEFLQRQQEVADDVIMKYAQKFVNNL